MRFLDEYNILRKKKDKKSGFAATALLISIAIILLLIGLFVFLLGKVNKNNNKNDVNSGNNIVETNNSNGNNNNNTNNECTNSACQCNKETIFNDNLKNIKDAAVSYYTYERLPQKKGETRKLTLREMLEQKLVFGIVDSNSKTCDGNKSYVEVTKEDNEYIMKVYLSCSDLEDYIIIHLGCYDYCNSKVCEKQIDNVVEFEYEYKKTTSCTMSPWSNWSSWTTTREKTSNLKKEEIKTETITSKKTDTQKSIANPVTYNCDKYGSEYNLVNGKCIKTETKNATKTNDTYNCDKYGKEYQQVGDKCIKSGTRDVQNAAKNESTYSCPSGYTRSTINYTVKSGDTISKVASANNISVSALKLANKLTSDTLSVGQKLTIPAEYQTKCYKDVPKTDPQPAKAIYKTTYVTTTCYESICSTQLVPSCNNGYCEIEEVRTCDKVSRNCQKPKQTFSHYDCSNYSSDYKLSGSQCIRTYSVREYANATKNADTYNCDNYSGYTKSGTTCYKDIPAVEKPATVVYGDYVCDTKNGYVKSGTKCIRTTTKDAEKNKQTYRCQDSSYSLTKDNTACTKTLPVNTKVTYYRYAFRTCTGGSTSTKWSLNSNDTNLLNDGYKKTGVKREYKVIEK